MGSKTITVLNHTDFHRMKGLFCVSIKERMHTGLEQHEDENIF